MISLLNLSTSMTLKRNQSTVVVVFTGVGTPYSAILSCQCTVRLNKVLKVVETAGKVAVKIVAATYG